MSSGPKTDSRIGRSFSEQCNRQCEYYFIDRGKNGPFGPREDFVRRLSDNQITALTMAETYVGARLNMLCLRNHRLASSAWYNNRGYRGSPIEVRP